ncbi:histidine kinase [Reichenbachiella agarivorans]|uniref:Histidine kinase n=1 Tax=Reichenbachiella agarivorans TaxID=2979464 RepID=A0ABY6CPG5_9BACT|nr:histidine kinase [Reichenbachiella agarivorans]UXP32406.1 histidine kinase [Reichenbachiella agarivorans]
MNNRSINVPSYLGFLSNPFIQHALFWIIYFAFNWIRWGSFFDDYVYSFKSNLVEFPLHIALVYFTVYFLMPRLLPDKIGWFIIALFGVTLFISYLKIIITFIAVTTDIYKEANRTDIGIFDFVYVADVFIGELYVVAVAISVKITIDWIAYKNKANELVKTNLETELAFLKSQIQPHFFFNTLNNLYSLTLDKSDKAPYTVLKLSELMSYVIYDAKQKRVPLINEIKHIQNYLDLEMLRYGDKLEIDLAISGDIEGKRIPPVLLLPFIENSFKHGTKADSETIPIDISLEVIDNMLTFSTENLRSKADTLDNGLENYKQGVGMTNTKRRLNLVYGDKHSMNIIETEDKYKIVLKIPLD